MLRIMTRNTLVVVVSLLAFACALSGCETDRCPPGTVDMDRQPANGCECVISAEVCDGVDNDCDGLSDDGVTLTWRQDADGDTYGNPSTYAQSCQPPDPSWKKIQDLGPAPDCDDKRASIHPGATEICDGVDEDCDGQEDNGIAVTTWLADLDGDQFPTRTATAVQACKAPTGFVAARDTNGDGQPDWDCDDANGTIYPGAPELCDGRLNNCLRTTPDQLCPSSCGGLWPVNASANFGHAIAAQLDDDHELEVLSWGHKGVNVFNHDGSLLWNKEKDDTLNWNFTHQYSYPTIGDVNMDGKMDVVHATARRLYIHDGATGNVLKDFTGIRAHAAFGGVAVTDVNGDGYMDLVTDGTGSAYIIFLGSGLAELSRVELVPPTGTYFTLATPFLVDLDGDSKLEVGLGTGNHTCVLGQSCIFRLPIFGQNGNFAVDTTTSFNVSFTNSGFAGEGAWPLVADLDGDGVEEILQFVSQRGGSGTGLYAWRRNGASHSYVRTPWQASIQRLIFAPIDDSGRLTQGALRDVNGAVADLDGDGIFEVIQGTEEGLTIAAAGKTLSGFPIGPPAGGSPTLADLDHDGRMEIIYLSLADARLHCIRLGTSTYSWTRILSPGFAGWSQGAYRTNTFDPYEPNDPTLAYGGRFPALSALTSSNAPASLRALALAPFRRRALEGGGRQIHGMIGARGDRDFYWLDFGGGVFSATLELPHIAPVSYGLRVHFYDKATDRYAGSLEATGSGRKRTLWCAAWDNPCPTGWSATRAILEVYPSDAASDFGPWPYRLTL